MPKEAGPRPTPKHLLPPDRLSPPCDVESSPSTDTTLDYEVERLPRELRDLIYFYMISDDLTVPFHLNEERLQAPFASPELSAELLEAVFTHRPCLVTFCDPSLLSTGQLTPAIRGDDLPHRDCIRHLVVEARESPRDYVQEVAQLERSCADSLNNIRAEWNEILALPRLESLTIELQKSSILQFHWLNFSPIVYRLRERAPRTQIKLRVSFDELMEPEWNRMAALYAGVEGAELMRDVPPTPGDPYLSMGFADVSELIEPPTADDYDYVNAHLSELVAVGAQGSECGLEVEKLVKDGFPETRSRNIMSGLMAETPSDRRQLAEHYVVKEPSLLRILMAEHYKYYDRVNGESTEVSIA